ncbi:hypothetical protein [Fluviispira multicolorata]|uniref:Uncharacterized protein n=1 Tax=Fluviispira multicolorata TaxID=2654512 RepID=A0A833N4P8_9BACT|nr:hypothetical protein [Fluviispira multicolorata]KAB8028519.1 hypothetical protein GCL57_12400 [Fluviispira multicolorata]
MNKKKISKNDNSTQIEYEYLENNKANKVTNTEFKFPLNILNAEPAEESEYTTLFYVDLSTVESPNNYIFYQEYNQISDEHRSNVKIIDINDSNHPVFQFLPEEIKNDNVFLWKSHHANNILVKSINIKEIVGLQQSYNFHIKEGIKLTETLNQGVITISKVSSTVGKVFTVLGTLGGYASAAGSAFSAAKSLLGMFIPELKEPSIADVLNKLEEIRAEFKAAIEQLKSEIKLLLKEAFINDYITKTRMYIEATAQLSESYFKTYVTLIQQEGTEKFDEKSLLGHLFNSQNSYFNFLFKQLTDPSSTDAIYNAINIIIDKNYVKQTILAKPNEKYDATRVYTENGANWSESVNVIGALDFSLPDYYSETSGYDATYVLKASTKVFANLVESFIFVSQHLLDYYVTQELDKQKPTYAILRPQIETAFTEIDKRLTIIISTWEEYYRQSVQETENYALRLWKNMFYTAAAKAKCVSLTFRRGYPGTHKDFVSGIGSRYNQSKFWKTDSYGYATYEFAIRKDYSDSDASTGYNSIMSHTSLWSLQQGLYNGWGREGWGLSPRGRNAWTYNYITELHELRPKIAIMVWSESHKNHIKKMLDFDSTIDSLKRLKASVQKTQSTWFKDNEYYPLARRQSVDIYEFSKGINLNKFIYNQPNIFPASIVTQTEDSLVNMNYVASNKIKLGFRYAHRLGLSKQDIVWNSQENPAPLTGSYIVNIPKYSSQMLINQQSIPYAEIYIKAKSNNYLVNKVDYDKIKCNLTGIDPLEDLIKAHPLFSLDKDLINSTLATYPSLLRSIHKDISYNRLDLDFGNWTNTIQASLSSTKSFRVSVGIRPLFKNEKDIILFGDIAWLYSEANKFAYRNHLSSNGTSIYHKFHFKGLPRMTFNKIENTANSVVNLKNCGFQIVYSYYIYDSVASSPKLNITSKLDYPIYSSGTGIAYECIEKSYDASPIEIILGKSIWLS